MNGLPRKLMSVCPIFLLILIGFEIQAQTVLTYTHDNKTRQYILHKSANLPNDAPLVFVLHGYTGSAGGIAGYCGMNSIADANGFAVCYPQGTTDNFNIPHWNANLSISTTDDIGFLSELAGYLQVQHDFSPKCTYVCGMSNGGFMSYTLACEAPDVFKAIASVTGTMSGHDWNNCNPSEPVPVLHIHGTADYTVPINGSISASGGWAGAPHVDTVVASWVTRNNCTSTSGNVIIPSTLASYHKNGINNNEVWYHKITNWGHAWPTAGSNTGTVASELIWDFFSQDCSNTTTSIENPESGLDNMRIYPNPFKTIIDIEGITDQMEFQIINLNGQMILSGTFHQNHELDLSELPLGLYLLKINDRSVKIIKIE